MSVKYLAMWLVVIVNYYIMKKKRFATWRAPAVIPEWYQKGIENAR
jgi:hypothetical protein